MIILNEWPTIVVGLGFSNLMEIAAMTTLSIPQQAVYTGSKVMARVKKKRVPVSEQYSNLQAMCRNVVKQLANKGIEVPKTNIQLIGDGLPDSKTKAMVINALAPV